MSRHYQVESHMSLTGSNADNRILVKPSEQEPLSPSFTTQLGGAPDMGLNANAKKR